MSKNSSLPALILSVLGLCCAVVSLVLVLSRPAATLAADESAGKSIQYVMYVGTNDKDTYQPEHSQEEAREIVDQVCLKYFEGYTLQEATGAWTDETGQITHEYTLDADKATVYRAADEVIEALNQNTVLIEEDEISIEFYGRE